MVDQMFAKNAEKAGGAGLHVGAYHFAVQYTDKARVPGVKDWWMVMC